MTSGTRAVRSRETGEHVNEAERTAAHAPKPIRHHRRDAGRAFQTFAHAAGVAVRIVIMLVGALVGAAGRGGFLKEQAAFIIAVLHGVERIGPAHGQRRHLIRQFPVGVVGIARDGDGRAADLVGRARQRTDRIIAVAGGDLRVGPGHAVLVKIQDGLAGDAAIPHAGLVISVVRLAAQTGGADGRPLAHHLIQLVED